MIVATQDLPAAAAASAPGRLPMAALLAFAWAGLVAILTETMPAGLLPLIGRGLGVSDVLAGQLVTAYAAGSVLAAVPLTAATAGLRRRPVLLAAFGGLLAFNTVTAVAGRYDVVLAARFLAGVSSGLAWGMISGCARRLVPAERQGWAMAVAMAGTPVALAIGTPAGAMLGAAAGWRAAFGTMSCLTLGLAGWVAWAVPDRPGLAADRRLSVASVLPSPGLLPILVVVFAWMLGHSRRRCRTAATGGATPGLRRGCGPSPTSGLRWT